MYLVLLMTLLKVRHSRECILVKVMS